MDRPPLPTFVIIGAQKCATRWLRLNLGEHPQIFSARSELSFWNSRPRVRRLGLDWYRDQFVGWNGEPITGEATPGYLIWRHGPAEVAGRMKTYMPDLRLIVILRDPVERAQSAMLHHIRRGRIPSGSRLLDVVWERHPPESDKFCLVSGGWYAASLSRYVEYFGDQLLVLLHDDVVTNPEKPFQAALRHIGADLDFRPRDLSRVIYSNQLGRVARKSTISIEDRIAMWDYYRVEIARLEAMVGIDLSRWSPDVNRSVAGESLA